MAMPERPRVFPTSAPRTGFTIIELLAVVAIIAVLATIAIAKFGDSKRRAYIAAMKADLHSVGMMAESKFAAEHSYANLVPPEGSAGVVVVFEGTSTQWTATASHSALPGFQCSIRSGGGGDSEPICR